MPSLSALRAFEAAARTGSLSAAARELNVTHAAVAQHLRTLSDHFGEPLMRREGQGMTPTPPGRLLAAALSEGFGRIAEGVEELRAADEERPLRITTTPSFAENWLMPRLGQFWTDHPDIPLSIAPATDNLDLRSGGFDMAIRYGRGGWKGLEESFLVSAGFVIAAAPRLLEARPEFREGDLRGATWLFETEYQEPRIWAEETGLIDARTRIVELPTVGLILSGVRSGLGVAVLFRPLLEADLAAGSITILREIAREGLGYYVLTRPGTFSAARQTFVKWLRRQARTSA